MKTFHPYNWITLCIAAGLLLAGCGQAAASATVAPSGNSTATETAGPAASLPPALALLSATPDPCAKANLPPEIQKLDELTRQFDDATAIVANMLGSINADQLGSDIATLQSIRRNAEDLTVPGCLQNLKSLQLSHMNTIIDYFLLILGHGDKKVQDQAAAQANQLSQQYIIEKARLLGILTIIPETATGTPGTPGAATPVALPSGTKKP